MFLIKDTTIKLTNKILQALMQLLKWMHPSCLNRYYEKNIALFSTAHICGDEEAGINPISKNT